MSKLFLDIFNLSIAASWLIAAVLIARALLKNRVPSWIVCLLWALVGIRLVIPFSFESELSLVPSEQAIKPDAVYSETAPPRAAPTLPMKRPTVRLKTNCVR